MVNLFEDQLELIKKVYDAIDNGIKRLLIYSPTGSGKTVMSSYMMIKEINRNNKVLFLVNKKDLIHQTVVTLQNKFDYSPGIIHREYDLDINNSIQISTIQTLINRDNLPKFDYIFIDEAHGSAAPSYETILNKYENAIVIGLSASPTRTKEGEGLGHIYETIVEGKSLSELIEMGRLVNYKHYCWDSDAIDLSKVKSKNGEYDIKELEIAVNTDELNNRMIEEWFNKAYKKRTIVFAISKTHAKNIQDAFIAKGIPFSYVDANTSSEERRKIYKDLHDLNIYGIASVGVLTEGFDEPSAEVAFCARPTKSRILYIQMIGRILRKSDETNKEIAIALDFAGNIWRFGELTEPVHFSLIDGISEVDEEVLKLIGRCPHCGIVLKNRICELCGFEKEPPVRYEDGIIPEVDFIEIGENGIKIVSEASLKLLFDRIELDNNSNIYFNNHHIGIFDLSEMVINFDQDVKISDFIYMKDDIFHKLLYSALAKKGYFYKKYPFYAYHEFKKKSKHRKDNKYIKLIQRHAIFGKNFTEQNKVDYFNHLVKYAQHNGKYISMVNSSYQAEFGTYPKKDGFSYDNTNLIEQDFKIYRRY